MSDGETEIHAAELGSAKRESIGGQVVDPDVEVHLNVIAIDGEVFPFSEFEFQSDVIPSPNGVVIRGTDNLDRPIALKLWLTMRPEDPRDKVAQGRAEARKIAALAHRNIVPIYSAGALPNGTFYVVMEWLEGITLRKLLELGPDIETRFKIWDAISRALRYAHKRGVLHGDLHSGNVMICGSRTYIIDFGTSLFAEQGEASIRESRKLSELARQLFADHDFKVVSDERPHLLPPGLGLDCWDAWVELLRVSAKADSLRGSRPLDKYVEYYEKRGLLNRISLVATEYPYFAVDRVVSWLADLGFSPQAQLEVAYMITETGQAKLETSDGEATSVSFGWTRTDLAFEMVRAEQIRLELRDRYVMGRWPRSDFLEEWVVE